MNKVCKKGHDYDEGKSYCPTCNSLARSEYLFGGNREKAIQRDGEKCVKCGMTREEHKIKFSGKDITVDHKDKLGSGVARNLKNNDMSNLQTLCIPCHASKDNIQKKLTLVNAINIRHMRGSAKQYEIAKLYGVSQTYISMVQLNKWHKQPTN